MITPELKLVVPIQWNAEGEPSAFAYHTPIGTEVFEKNYRVLAATKYAIFTSKDLMYARANGPQIATLELRKAAAGEDPGDGSIIRDTEAFLTELTRRTLVLAPTASEGVREVPVEIALRNGLDAEDWKEALSTLVFFTCGYSTVLRRQRKAVGDWMESALTASFTSLLPSDYLDSLPKLTPAVPSATAPSSEPS